MGIPSYYKKLADNIDGLIRYGHPEGEEISWLFMDFNCLIYHCLHREDTPVYPGEQGKDEWEKTFIECIIQYCMRVVKQVQPKDGIYLAIDGVVPMAKMKQQRLRRFKSVWEAKRSGSTEPKWNTNAITPGTDFMQTLHTGLQRMSKSSKHKWIISTSNEPGEGEHKIMQQWRSHHVGNATSFAVYGLDADLVVLSLLNRHRCQLKNVWLFRERMEEGSIKYEDGLEQFEWFSIHSLSTWITEANQISLPDYCFAMSVLGNDFLPSSLGMKMRNDGHTILLQTLSQVDQPLLFNYEISFSGLQQFFSILAQTEVFHLEEAIHKKQMIALNLKKGSQPSMNLGEHNWPLHHIEESILLSSNRYLTADWQKRYQMQFFSGQSVSEISQAYLYGIQWIWAYYCGNMDQVCFNWYYPYSLPPLWNWISRELGCPLREFPGSIQLSATDILPTEQLALVLPLESWSLLPARAAKEKQFPLLAPHYFPSEFGFDSAGKRYFWECEASIPLPNMVELKAIIS